jgi:hypothetical protein
MVRVHHGPFFISSNAELVYDDLIARGKQVETAKRWRALVQRFEACCGIKGSYDRADVIKFIAELRKEGMKQSSINSRLKALRLLCQIQNWDGGFPQLSMPKVKDSEVSRPFFTVDEVVHIISKAKEVCSERELSFLAAAAVSTSVGTSRRVPFSPRVAQIRSTETPHSVYFAVVPTTYELSSSGWVKTSNIGPGIEHLFFTPILPTH